MHSLNFLGGLITTFTFTLMMKSSKNENNFASHYAFLGTIEISSKLLLSSISGILVDNLSYSWAFGFYTLITLNFLFYF